MCSMVDEALVGLTMINSGMVLLGKRIVARRDYVQFRDRVVLVSGGASGHEPFPAGYVGPGMLTAAIVGDISVAPPPLAIMHLVRHLARGGAPGALLVTCDRPGDRLSFTVAAERLVSEGTDVRLLTVAGAAGAVLVFKVAGAMLERGVSLDELFTLCFRVVAGLTTVNVDPHPPGVSKCLGDSELGGEKSACQVSVATINQVVTAVEKEFQNLPPPSVHLTVLINNMGQMSKLSEQVFATKTMEQFASHGHKVARLYCGNFATCRDEKGFSVTVLQMLVGQLADLLDAATSAPGWPRTPCPVCRQEDVVCPEEAPAAGVEAWGPVPGDAHVLEVVGCATRAVAACEEQLNILDSHHGDGDCGTTLRMGAEAIARAIQAQQLDCSSPSTLLACLADICGKTMGGVSGAVYYVLFTAAAHEAGSSAGGCAWGPGVWVAALKAGVAAAARLCGAPPGGGGTMLDALEAAAAALDQHVAGSGPGDGVAAASRAARAAELAALRTSGPPHLHPDPGAHAVAICLRGVCEGVKRLGSMPGDHAS